MKRSTFKLLRGCQSVRRIHESATSGFTADKADVYNRGRIDYSPESIAKVAQLIREYTPRNTYKDPVHVLELGAGTGKFTFPLVEYCGNPPEGDGFEAFKNLKFVATEPSDFSQVLRQDAPPDVEVKFGTGAAIPAEKASLDAIVCAESFHWMATEATVNECHRALKPGKPMVMVWYAIDYNKIPWFKLIADDIIQPRYIATNTPHHHSEEWKTCFEWPGKTDLFTPLEYWYGTTVQEGKFHIVYDRVLSISVMAMLEEPEKQEVREYIRNLLATHPDLERERETGDISIPFITEIAWATAL